MRGTTLDLKNKQREYRGNLPVKTREANTEKFSKRLKDSKAIHILNRCLPCLLSSIGATFAIPSLAPSGYDIVCIQTDCLSRLTPITCALFIYHSDWCILFVEPYWYSPTMCLRQFFPPFMAIKSRDFSGLISRFCQYQIWLIRLGFLQNSDFEFPRVSDFKT